MLQRTCNVKNTKVCYSKVKDLDYILDQIKSGYIYDL